MILSSRVKGLLAVAGASLLFFASCGNPAAMNQSTANVKHVTQAEFGDEITNSPLPVVVDFYATWCGPCKELSPLLDRVAGGYPGKIKFLKVNVDESPALAQNYQLQAIPTVLMFKAGKLVNTTLGVPAETDLKSKLDALAAK